MVRAGQATCAAGAQFVTARQRSLGVVDPEHLFVAHGTVGNLLILDIRCRERDAVFARRARVVDERLFAQRTQTGTVQDIKHFPTCFVIRTMKTFEDPRPLRNTRIILDDVKSRDWCVKELEADIVFVCVIHLF
jgi:hypothetical protein